MGFATAFLGGATMMPAFAQEKKLSKAEQVLLKHAIASCKSEAKTKKVKLLSRRQYVIDCVQALKDRPQVNVPEYDETTLKTFRVAMVRFVNRTDARTVVGAFTATPAIADVRFWHLADIA